MRGKVAKRIDGRNDGYTEKSGGGGEKRYLERQGRHFGRGPRRKIKVFRVSEKGRSGARQHSVERQFRQSECGPKRRDATVRRCAFLRSPRPFHMRPQAEEQSSFATQKSENHSTSIPWNAKTTITSAAPSDEAQRQKVAHILDRQGH